MKRDNSLTRRFLAEAGIAPGMRVLELGCGHGEVTQLLAELVGPSGSVVAVDYDTATLKLVQEKFQSQGISTVQFVSANVSGKLSELVSFPKESFDALAGRRILMYLQDPAEVLRRFSLFLRHEGIVVFEEADSTMVPGRITSMPAHDQATDWLRQMLLAEGANPSMGFHLPATVVQAGLTFGKVRAEAIIQGQGTQFPLADLMGLMKSRLAAAGIATETDIASLVARLQKEASDPTRVFVSDVSFCAWGYKS